MLLGMKSIPGTIWEVCTVGRHAIVLHQCSTSRVYQVRYCINVPLPGYTKCDVWENVLALGGYSGTEPSHLPTYSENRHTLIHSGGYMGLHSERRGRQKSREWERGEKEEERQSSKMLTTSEQRQRLPEVTCTICSALIDQKRGKKAEGKEKRLYWGCRI